MRSNDLPFDKKRVIVLHEAGWVCVECGGEATEADHIWPKRWGGTDDLSNLQAMCRSCNARKGDTIYVQHITPLRCGWKIAKTLDAAVERMKDAARWESARRAIVEGATADEAADLHLMDDGLPTEEATRFLLSWLWKRLLHETPGQAALDALADLERFHLIDAEEIRLGDLTRHASTARLGGIEGES